MQPTPVFLPGEPHEQYEKAKDMTVEMSSPGWKVSNMLLEKRGEIAPKRVKRLSQSEHDTKLRMCLLVKVKSDAIKNYIA